MNDQELSFKEVLILNAQKLFILIVHLVLLAWMLWTLKESGRMQISEVLMHFVGMSLLGGITIRGTAWWANYHWKKELAEQNKKLAEDKALKQSQT